MRVAVQARPIMLPTPPTRALYLLHTNIHSLQTKLFAGNMYGKLCHFTFRMECANVRIITLFSLYYHNMTTYVRTMYRFLM